MTPQDLITRSLTIIRQLGPGRTAGASESAHALKVLQGMIDQWNIDPLMIYSPLISTYTLTPSQLAYTIGTTGSPDFNAARPERIEWANLLMTNLTPTLRRPITIINKDQWGEIKLQGVHSTLADTVSLPSGYSDAIAYNLAVRLAIEWDKPLRPEIAQLAIETKAAVELHNAPSPLMECDGAVLGSSATTNFNRLTGELE